jgi:hypothetical protein
MMMTDGDLLAPHSLTPSSPQSHSPLLKLDEEFVEMMKDDDLLTAMFKEMRETFPELMRPLLYDRCVCVGGGGAGCQEVGRGGGAARAGAPGGDRAPRPLHCTA